MSELLTFLINHSTESALITAVFITVFLQVIKNKLNFASARHMVVIVLGLISTVLTYVPEIANYVINNVPLDAPGVLGKYAASLVGFCVVLHTIAVSPLYKMIQNVTATYKDGKVYRTEHEDTTPVQGFQA